MHNQNMKTLKLVTIEMYLRTQYYLNCAVLQYKYVEQSSTNREEKSFQRNLKLILEKNLFEQEIIWMER